MRDLFSYRRAFRCTTDSSSDVVLGHGWAGEGYTAADIDPLARGVGWLLSESGTPPRIKAAYLDTDIAHLAAIAADLRARARRMTTAAIPSAPVPAANPTPAPSPTTDAISPSVADSASTPAEDLPAEAPSMRRAASSRVRCTTVMVCVLTMMNAATPAARHRRRRAARTG